MTSPGLSLTDTVGGLKAAGEPTRLRLLALLAHGELSVKDLTEILGQSQPRISRHLKVLAEAELVERAAEGNWVYYRLADAGAAAAMIRELLSRLDAADRALVRDRDRLAEVRTAHSTAAKAYFDANAADWDRIRSLYVPEAAVDEAISKALGQTPFDALLDLGTGTGRMLELLAGSYRRGIGIDTSEDMLRLARGKLATAGIAHAQVRHGDVYDLGVPDEGFDVVVVHQVLHYLDDPGRALAEAARALAPGGRMVVVDFAPHALEFLRADHAHRRLGFTDEQISQWLEAAGVGRPTARALPPRAGTGELTVKLWLARKAAAGTAVGHKAMAEAMAV